jgi:threonine synthase
MTPQLPASAWRGLIHRYRGRLPVTETTPVVTLHEGNTPLIPVPNFVKAIGGDFELHLKYEGLNPTASFKDRGMTLAVSKAVERGAKVVICASTGNTSASAAAYAARAGIRCVVLLPNGKIALGKLAQALMYGATTIAIQGNFDVALRIVRELGETGKVEVVNSVNPVRIEGQKTAAFEICDQLGRAPDFHFLPVGNAGNITAYWKGFREYNAAGIVNGRPRMFGWQAAGAAPIVDGKPVEDPHTVATAIRIGNPASWQGCSERHEGFGRAHRQGDRRRDPRRLPPRCQNRGHLRGTGLCRAIGGPHPVRSRKGDPNRQCHHRHHDRPWAEGSGHRHGAVGVQAHGGSCHA